MLALFGRAQAVPSERCLSHPRVLHNLVVVPKRRLVPVRHGDHGVELVRGLPIDFPHKQVHPVSDGGYDGGKLGGELKFRAEGHGGPHLRALDVPSSMNGAMGNKTK